MISVYASKIVVANVECYLKCPYDSAFVIDVCVRSYYMLVENGIIWLAKLPGI
jgi:hypothetical protein